MPHVSSQPPNPRPDPDPSPEPGKTEPRTPAVLREIMAVKSREVAEAKARAPLGELEALVAQEEPPRNFFRAVTRKSDRPAVIAEIKRRSPSAGLIRPEYDGDGFRPEDIARAYFRNGASAISCLTDENFFGGHLSYIRRVKEAVPLPVIRKDFLIDPYQLWESRAHGADAVLLIAECLTESQIVDMLILAQQLQLTVLLEVHSMENLLRVRPHIGFPHPAYCLLGINNRDLTTMTVDLGHTLRLVDIVDDRSVLVSESGIKTPDDLKRLKDEGVRIVLVGEHLMRQPSPGRALAELLGTEPVDR
ncbi:MAG: indole-3-glycerol phosphate synthase TrpC [Planctomycetota bacterium]|nr:MAG: indole-3-glycerol phosphate synthase TrpC [Planctomycetota bacterium]